MNRNRRVTGGQIFLVFARALLVPLSFFILFNFMAVLMYHKLEGVDWIEALYWITHPHAIDFHGPVKRVTRLFAIFVYTGVFFFQVWFAERVLITLFGQKRSEIWGRLMNRIRIQRLNNHFIVCGYGQVGRTVVDQLQKAGLDFVLIEFDESLVRELVREGIPVIASDARRRNILTEAGTERARGICVVIDNDADNLYITIPARMLNPDIWIASRAGNLRYAEALKGAGANEVFIPEYEGGLMLFRMIERLVGLRARLE